MTEVTSASTCCARGPIRQAPDAEVRLQRDITVTWWLFSLEEAKCAAARRNRPLGARLVVGMATVAHRVLAPRGPR